MPREDRPADVRRDAHPHVFWRAVSGEADAERVPEPVAFGVDPLREHLLLPHVAPVPPHCDHAALAIAHEGPASLRKVSPDQWSSAHSPERLTLCADVLRVDVLVPLVPNQECAPG